VPREGEGKGLRLPPLPDAVKPKVQLLPRL
jgi:hypothetical protein